MNLLLILRSEIISLLVLILMLWYSSIHGSYDNIRSYRALNLLAIGHVIFDMITVVTVNNLEIVPPLVNRICHEIFYMLAILFCFALFYFVLEIVYGKEPGKRMIRIVAVIPAAYLIVMNFLPIEYVEGRGTNYSYGPCVFAGYGCAVVLFLLSLVILVMHKDRLSGHDRRILIPAFVVMLAAVIIQMLVPEILFTGADSALVAVAIFIGIIDPVGKFRHKAYYDLMTGLRNHNCYEDDMKELRAEIGKDAYARGLICVSCDINGLKQVNDEHGHSAGDDYIRMASRALKDSLVSSYAIYRTGGDEFFAVYLDKPKEMVKAEIARLRKAFGTSRSRKGSDDKGERLYSFSIGYAVAMRGENISETAKRADVIMMEEKRRYYRESGVDRRHHAPSDQEPGA